MLKEGLTVSIFYVSTFSMVLCFFASSNGDLSKTHNFLNKTIFKHRLFVLKYSETAINTKFSTVNHYLTNLNTKN